MSRDQSKPDKDWDAESLPYGINVIDFSDFSSNTALVSIETSKVGWYKYSGWVRGPTFVTNTLYERCPP